VVLPAHLKPPGGELHWTAAIIVFVLVLITLTWLGWPKK